MSVTRQAGTASRRAAHSQSLKMAARAGFVARGAIYLLIGIIALQIALGHGGQADRGGALAQIAAKSYGTVTLLLLVVGSTVWHCGGSARQLSAQLGPTVTRPASG